MWPWGHLGVAYLAYSMAARRTAGRPGPGAAAAVAVGSQLPDLVDKPLAWSLGVLPAGRTFGHSLLVALPLLAAGLVVLDRRRGRLAAALAAGHVSHALVDALPVVWTGEYADARFLLWPATPPIDPPVAPSFLAHLAALSPTPYQVVQVGLFAAAVALWVDDGAPGLAGALSRLGVGRGAES